jgi:gamma-glutamyltranspeptidase / glutathione hydrolase
VQDAAVAVAAALNITEPTSTGIGGDMFCLFYDSKTKKVHAMNGSGRSGAHATLDHIRHSLGIPDGQPGKMPLRHIHSVTVPGAAAGWVDCVQKFGSGRVSLEQILTPAIELGEKGFPVSELASGFVGDRFGSLFELVAHGSFSGKQESLCSALRLQTFEKCLKKTHQR